MVVVASSCSGGGSCWLLVKVVVVVTADCGCGMVVSSDRNSCMVVVTAVTVGMVFELLFLLW